MQYILGEKRMAFNTPILTNSELSCAQPNTIITQESKALNTLYSTVNETIENSKTNDKNVTHKETNNALKNKRILQENKAYILQAQERGRESLTKFVNGNEAMQQDLDKIIKNVNLHDLSIQNTPENKEILLASIREYINALGENIETLTTKDNEAMKRFAQEQFSVTFEYFKDPETQIIPFTYTDIIRSSLLNMPLQKDAAREKAREDQSLASNTNTPVLTSSTNTSKRTWKSGPAQRPQIGDGIETYLTEQMRFILQETSPNGKFKYLYKEPVDHFVEVIEFVKSGGTTKLSPLAYDAYMNMLKDTKYNDNKKWLRQKIRNANRSGRNNNQDEFFAMQKTFITSHEFYQLGMHEVAEEAKKIMNTKINLVQEGEMAPNEEEKIRRAAEFISELTPEESKYLVENFQDKKHLTYTVTNQYVDKADSSLEGQIAGRITPINAVLDQVLRSGFMAMALLNLVIGIQSGDWSSSFPLVAAGVAGTAFLANGVTNSGFAKMLYPEKMLDNILKESNNNKYYKDFFENSWEVALAKNMDWSNKKGLLKDIQKVENDNGEITKITYDNRPTEKLSLLNGHHRRIKKRFTESMTIHDFKENNPMSKYLTKSHYLGPDGKMYTKENFLDQVEKHSDHYAKDKDGVVRKIIKEDTNSNHVRFDMYTRIAERIGEKDSFIPLFNQLHNHYINAPAN